MKIPKQLKIGGHIVDIDCTQELKNEDGKWESREGKIYICKTLPQTQKEQTLIHEILHASNSVFGDSEIAHIVLESISQQLYQVLKDNDLLK